jgi:4-hydroxybenzoate polyprenyltransferase/phosphoserine phosphatase
MDISVERENELSREALIPLCVDLDGTLTPSDLLDEGVAKLLRTRPRSAFKLIAWTLAGKAYLKQQVADRAAVDARVLPYNTKLLAFLDAERAKRRKIVLITGADRRAADAVAAHLGVFDSVYASDGSTNLTGARKAEMLVENYGERLFDYVGNGRSDLPVWRHARRALVVDADPAVRRAADRAGNADLSLGVKKSWWPSLLRAMRPHQWIKNLLIFLPLIFAHRISDGRAVFHDVLAFISFSIAASAIYLINDLADLENDRKHRTKRRRPFASGALPLRIGFAFAPGLLALGIALALVVSPAFAAMVVGYVILSLTYSFSLKQIALLDVIVLAGLYTSRIIAGSVAAGVVASFWLLAFALFMFTSLAMVKRYSELLALRAAGNSAVSGRDYSITDSDMIAMFGVGSGYVAVLVVALYINGDLVRHLYAHPGVLWGICPILLYWISRVWLIAHRGDMHDDPILFAIRDRTSLVVAMMIVAVGLAAMLPVRF